MAGWDSNDTVDYNGEEQPNELTQALVYGNRARGEQPAPTPAALPGAQPAQGNYSTKDTGAPSIPNSTMSHPMQSNEDDDLKPPTYSPSATPTAPDAHLDQYQKFEQQLQAPAPDHNNPALKPKWYDQVRGRLAAGLLAFGGNPQQAVEAGSNVINRRFNNATNDYQNQQASARHGLAALRDQSEAANQDFERQMQLHNAGTADYNSQERAYQGQVTARDRRAQEQQRLQGIAPGSEAPDDPQNPMAGWHGTTIGGKQIKMAQPPDSWLKTPQGVAAQRDADVQRLGLKGDDAKFYRANGKLKEPAAQIHIHNPSADEKEWDTYLKALGHPPTTEDVINFKRGNGRGGSGGGGKMSDAEGRLIQAQRDKSFEKAQGVFKTATHSAQTDAERQDAEDDFLDSAELAQRAFESQINQRNPGSPVEPFDIRSALKSSLSGGAQPQQAPQSAPAPQSQPAQAPQQPQQQQAPPPTHARFNAGKWKAANPKGDVNAAIQAAKAKGYEIVGQ